MKKIFLLFALILISTNGMAATSQVNSIIQMCGLPGNTSLTIPEGSLPNARGTSGASGTPLYKVLSSNPATASSGVEPFFDLSQGLGVLYQVGASPSSATAKAYIVCYCSQNPNSTTGFQFVSAGATFPRNTSYATFNALLTPKYEGGVQGLLTHNAFGGNNAANPLTCTPFSGMVIPNGLWFGFDNNQVAATQYGLYVVLKETP